MSRVGYGARRRRVSRRFRWWLIGLCYPGLLELAKVSSEREKLGMWNNHSYEGGLTKGLLACLRGGFWQFFQSDGESANGDFLGTSGGCK